MSALVIAVFVAVFLAGDARGGASAWVFAWALIPQVALWVIGEIAVGALMRRVDRTGDPRAILWGDRVVFVQRVVGVAWHAFVVIALGWVGGVREAIGDWVLIDELVAASPPIALIAAGFSTQYGVDRRVRESLIIRRLDSGGVLPDLLTRGGFVSMSVRHQVLFMGVPMALIVGWVEVVGRVRGAAGWEESELVESGLHLAGALVVMAMMPALLTRIWRTRPLHAGLLRDRLVALGREHRVRLRDVLVWDTGLTQVNGAVMGLLARWRYVLLTDAMLAALGEREVEAVMAHEVAHVKHRHMQWMAAAVVAGVLIIGTPLSWGVQAVIKSIPWVPGGGGLIADGVVLVATLVGALVVLGFVSRRFELQADAHAAKHLSGWRPGGGVCVVTEDAVRTMAGSLGHVAALNGIPPGRFGWRHGSIRARQRALIESIGAATDRVPADRVAGRVKVAALVGVAAGVALFAADLALGWSGG